MTLHDHWVACAAGGQRFRADRERCETLDGARCGACATPQLGPALVLRGARQRRRHEAARSGSSTATSAFGAGPRGKQAVASRMRAAWTHMAASAGRAGVEARWRAMRRLAEDIDFFIAPSQDMRDAAIEFGLPADRCLHLPHGLSVDASPGPPPASRVRRFGYVGSLVPHKGLHDLVSAFRGLPEDATLDVYGSLHDAPDYVEALRSVIRHPGIRLHGEQAPERLPALVASLDAIVVPSIWRENAPLTILEAFALGRPVVASRIGGHPELCASQGPLLFEPGDVDGLAAILRRLCDEPDFGRQMAARIVRPRSTADHVASLEALYRRATGAPRAAGGPGAA